MHIYFFGRKKSHFSIQTLKEININQCTNGQHRNGVIFKKVTGLLIHPSSLTAIGMNAALYMLRCIKMLRLAGGAHPMVWVCPNTPVK